MMPQQQQNYPASARPPVSQGSSLGVFYPDQINSIQLLIGWVDELLLYLWTYRVSNLEILLNSWEFLNSKCMQAEILGCNVPHLGP